MWCLENCHKLVRYKACQFQVFSNFAGKIFCLMVIDSSCPVHEQFIFIPSCCSDISKVQDDEVGDGTTSVVVLACELLKVLDFYSLFIYLTS
jgi:hypothetical protein